MNRYCVLTDDLVACVHVGHHMNLLTHNLYELVSEVIMLLLTLEAFDDIHAVMHVHEYFTLAMMVSRLKSQRRGSLKSCPVHHVSCAYRFAPLPNC